MKETTGKRGAESRIRKSAIAYSAEAAASAAKAGRIPQSAIAFVARFARDETGQGMIFAAASLVVLIGFVAMVYNIGRVIEQRTRIQLAADSAAYSGAMVEANSLSTIAWINSAMAQTYYHSLKYAVDANVSAVAARMDMIQGRNPQEYLAAHRAATEALPIAKRLMVQLSQTENAIAILTPQLMGEEMYAVASRAGTERLSLFPSQRLFPHGGGEDSWRIEQYGYGWKVEHIGGNGEWLEVYLLNSNEWHMNMSFDHGMTEQELVITEVDAGTHWHITLKNDGKITKEWDVFRNENGRWTIAGMTYDSDGDATTMPEVTIEYVDMDGDGVKEGEKITVGDKTEIFKRGEFGMLYHWVNASNAYIRITDTQIKINGVILNVDEPASYVPLPGVGRAHIGNPMTIDLAGGGSITLSTPPRISKWFGPVLISIFGFGEHDFDIMVDGVSLISGAVNGRWRKWFDAVEEIWTRSRISEQSPTLPAIKSWLYEYQSIGALMTWEGSARASNFTDPQGDEFNRYVYHAFADRGVPLNPPPEWTDWFDPTSGRARNRLWSHRISSYNPPDPVTGLRTPVDDPPTDVFYLPEEDCLACRGTGKVVVPDPASPTGTREQVCSVCHAYDHNRDGTSDIRLFLYDLTFEDSMNQTIRQAVVQNVQSYAQWSQYLEADGVHRAETYGITERADYPLVLTEEFFKYGINVGAWKEPDTPMLFPAKHQPAWGYVAISSSRVGVPDSGGTPRYQFDDQEVRSEYRQFWVNNAPENLYEAGTTAKLHSSREQVLDYDLNMDALAGAVTTPSENGLSYVWNSVIHDFSDYEASNRFDRFEGVVDSRVRERLQDMTNRAGARFDYGDQGMSEVVEH